ncbi:hypothetical protein G9A89_011325 [Geosiphon pyriformis]|nr:hypothetical protein G9A89_011325 [Geosiphon pyriformis]
MSQYKTTHNPEYYSQSNNGHQGNYPIARGDGYNNNGQYANTPQSRSMNDGYGDGSYIYNDSSRMGGYGGEIGNGPPYASQPNMSSIPNRQPTFPLPHSNSFGDSNLNTQPTFSKPLYDNNDPKAPRPPSQYGTKHESTAYKEYAGSSKREGRNKYGGFMGTFCCCLADFGCGTTCVMLCCLLFLIIVAIVIAVLLWAKPPHIEFLGIGSSPVGLPPYVVKTNGFDFNFGLNIQVDNPNFVGADFKAIKATAFYPEQTTSIGGGNMTDVHIEAKGNTTIHFPFTINYDTSNDPGLSILMDILSKCGLTGGPKSKLQIDYKLEVTFKVIAITVRPSFKRTAEIDCPIQNGQIPNISGVDVNSALNAIPGRNKNTKSKPRV